MKPRQRIQRIAGRVDEHLARQVRDLSDLELVEQIRHPFAMARNSAIRERERQTLILNGLEYLTFEDWKDRFETLQLGGNGVGP